MVAFKTVQAWLFSLLATQSLAAVHEQLAHVPHTWEHVQDAADSTPITLRVALPEQNRDKIHSTLMSVSHPKSAKYGQHLSKADVDQLFAPKAGAADAVHSWLKGHGVHQIKQDGSFVHFHTDVGTANKMLNTKFAHYHSDGVRKLRTTQYSLPDDVQPHVDFVSPTTFFGKPRPHRPHQPLQYHQRATAALDPSCAKQITPDCLKQLYNYGSYKPNPSSGSKIGFGSFLNQTASYSDLALFEKQFNIPAQNFTKVNINNAQDNQGPSNDHGEANLDVQNIIGAVGGLPVTEFLTGGQPPFTPDAGTPDNTNEPYLDYYNYLLAQPDEAIPQVLSNSYGEPEQTVPKNYADKVCDQIAKLGMRGVTVLESSGDTGVGAACVTNDGKNTTRFGADFPASCPYVTAIGGTQSVSPEVAWDASSGGFSDYYQRPDYQTAAVDAYNKGPGADKFKEYNGKYADMEKGRGFPDISAHSLTPNYVVFENGKASQSGGTSAASPIVASIIALLNDALLQAGKKPLGFINPLLYSEGFADNLIDITGGAALGCTGINLQTGQPVPGGHKVDGAAWNATEGWDPSTGLGVPDFEKMKTAVLGTQPSPSPSPSPSPTPSVVPRHLQRPAVEVRWA